MPWMMLSPKEVEIVMRPANGVGGAQTLLRKIQASLDVISGDLELSQAEWLQVKDYAANYKRAGGFQARFQAVVAGGLRCDN